MPLGDKVGDFLPRHAKGDHKYEIEEQLERGGRPLV